MDHYTIKTADGEISGISIKILNWSSTLCQVVHDQETEGKDKGAAEGEDGVISLPAINCQTLQKVIEWISHRVETQNILRAIDPYVMNTQSQEWEQQFLETDTDSLLKIIAVADYLDIKGLRETAAQKIVDMLKGKSVEGIREKMNIESDFSHEEEEQVRIQLNQLIGNHT